MSHLYDLPLSRLIRENNRAYLASTKADLDGDAGGAFTGHDSVGYLGQSGHYSDAETSPIAPGGMLSVGGTYYDERAGR